MSTDEWKEMSEKIHYGLALAERRMLEQKALRNETMIVTTDDGTIKAIPAKRLLREARKRDKAAE
jgi:Arc/MetJ-type ribon-helix-helix transcriptional regulator